MATHTLVNYGYFYESFHRLKPALFGNARVAKYVASEHRELQEQLMKVVQASSLEGASKEDV